MLSKCKDCVIELISLLPSCNSETEYVLMKLQKMGKNNQAESLLMLLRKYKNLRDVEEARKKKPNLANHIKDRACWKNAV